MPRPKQNTKARTIRLYPDIIASIKLYAEKELISENLAINKLLIAKLSELGYMNPSDNESKK